MTSNSKTKVRKHGHYFKKSPYKILDVYRILELWQVTDPVLQHVVKKLLCAGGRGHKDLERDIQDCIDSLLRWQEMREEDREVEAAEREQATAQVAADVEGVVNNKADSFKLMGISLTTWPFIVRYWLSLNENRWDIEEMAEQWRMAPMRFTFHRCNAKQWDLFIEYVKKEYELGFNTSENRATLTQLMAEAAKIRRNLVHVEY